MIRTGFFTVVGSAAGVALILAYRISKKTGKSLPRSFDDVPAEAERYWAEIRARAEEAISVGREAARAKQAEIDKVLRGEGQTPPAN